MVGDTDEVVMCLQDDTTLLGATGSGALDVKGDFGGFVERFHDTAVLDGRAFYRKKKRKVSQLAGQLRTLCDSAYPGI